MGGHSISGFIVIFLACYLFYCLKRRKCRRPLISLAAYIVLFILFILGVTGLFYRSLEAINYILVGIIMIGICSKSHHPGGGGEYMYMRGWISAIAALIVGILKLLNLL